MSLGDRSVFQADQTDLAVGRLRGTQRQRGALAGMDRPLSLCVTALFELLVQMGAQFYSALYDSTGGFVGKTGLVKIIGVLWDSRRELPEPGAARTSLFPGILMNLWDSTRAKT